jgi:glyoxylase-like metal-dependent hydrolase (beta-lactamase superfamily II)
MIEIVKGIYTFTGLIAGRVYLLTEGDGLTLIDASIPPAGKKILAQLTAAGHKPADVKRIIITHAHPDHVGAVPALKTATNAEIIVPIGERAAFDGDILIPRASGGLRPPETVLKDMKADRTLQPDEIMDEVMGGLQAIFTPGHAPGHMAFWQPDRRILFCGDVLFNFPWLRLPFKALTVDSEENKQSVRRIVALKPEVVCFGHGKPITERASHRLQAFADTLS